MMQFPLAFFDALSPGTLLILGVIAVLLFGERLPEVSRSLGKKIVEFKKSFQGIQNEIRSATQSATSAISSGLSTDLTSSSSYSSSSYSTGSTGQYSSHEDRTDADDRDMTSAPKFVPPPAEPRVQSAEA